MLYKDESVHANIKYLILISDMTPNLQSHLWEIFNIRGWWVVVFQYES